MLFFGCGEKESSVPEAGKDKYSIDSSEIVMEPADNPGEQFMMEYRFVKGDPYDYRISMISDVSQVTTADTTVSMSVHNSRVYLLRLTPREIDNDGTVDLECEITSAKLEMEGNGNKVTYVSDTIKTAGDKEKFAEHHSLINNPFSIRLNKRGEILEIYKADKLVNSFLEYRNLKDSATAEDKNNLKTQIIETMLKPLLIQIFREVPEKSIAKDSIWTVKQPSRQVLSFQLDQTSRFKIKDLEKLKDNKIAVISADLDTKVTGESRHTEQGVSYNFSKPVIFATGTIYFNVDNGFVHKVRTETSYETFISAEGPTPKGIQKMTKKEIIKNLSFVEKI